MAGAWSLAGQLPSEGVDLPYLFAPYHEELPVSRA